MSISNAPSQRPREWEGISYQGHVDTVATILKITPDGNALTFRFQPRDKSVLRYIVEKGYVTLDGQSLTITKVDDVEGWWEVMLISYTQEKVVTASKKPGDEVNVEVDQIGSMLRRLWRGILKREAVVSLLFWRRWYRGLWMRG